MLSRIICDFFGKKIERWIFGSEFANAAAFCSKVERVVLNALAKMWLLPPGISAFGD